MNKKQKRINEAMRLVHPSYRPIKNVIKISKANSFNHELGKFMKCWELLNDEIDFYTEVIFCGGGRCDIFIPYRFQVIEILHSETTKEALSKTDKYPKELEIFLIKSEDVIKNEY